MSTDIEDTLRVFGRILIIDSETENINTHRCPSVDVLEYK
jgi:hypothetical protein